MKHTNICLIFGLYPKEEEQTYYENCKTLQNAANALEWSYVEGLKDYPYNVTILNLPMIPSYPDFSNIKRLRGFEFEVSDNIAGKNLPYCNLVYYKYFSMYHHAKKNLKKWVKSNPENRLVVVYGQYSPWLNASYSVKEKYPDLKIINIIPDVPQFLGFGKSIRYRMQRAVNEKLVNKGIKSIDGYILLSKYMKEVVPIGNKPWAVIEGIYNNKYTPKIPKEIPDAFKSGKKVVFYSGDLMDVYGVKDLVNAFHRLKRMDCNLVICGRGNSADYIANMSKIDPRIHFLGLVERDTVLYMQQHATLLVNPRDASGEFTKFSFPSKTMEYLSSGTPVLMCKLPGVPEEYFDYCFSCEKITEDKLLESMNEILSIDNEDLNKKGQEAQKFIITQKNPFKQCKKLIDLIDQL